MAFPQLIEVAMTPHNQKWNFINIYFGGILIKRKTDLKLNILLTKFFLISLKVAFNK